MRKLALFFASPFTFEQAQRKEKSKNPMNKNSSGFYLMWVILDSNQRLLPCQGNTLNQLS